MNVNRYFLLTLCIAAVTSQLGCGGNQCGVKPPDFSLPSGAFWDENKVRPEVSEVGESCEQYKRYEQRINASKRLFELPNVSYKESSAADNDGAAITFKLGTVDLSKEELISYKDISSVDAAFVQEAVARCQAAMFSYACVIFSDPENDPRIVGARRLAERVSLLEAITSKAKDAAEADNKEEFDNAVRHFKEALK